jgi:hypothetical protein
MYEQVRATLRERIERGATLEEIETIVLKSHGLRPEERRELWWYAWDYVPGPAAIAEPALPAPEPTLH